MKTRIIQSLPAWNYSLLIFICLFLFVIPLFPAAFQSLLYNLTLTMIFVLSAFNMERHKKTIITVALISMALFWITKLFNFGILSEVSSIITIAFFCIVVMGFIMMIARSKVVDQKVILNSINGYLLLGIMYALIVVLVAALFPGSLVFAETAQAAGHQSSDLANYIYFVLVTISTLGYGDALPVAPQARSLATLISISGQLYIAIIIAMLVGKYAGQQHHAQTDSST